MRITSRGGFGELGLWVNICLGKRKLFAQMFPKGCDIYRDSQSNHAPMRRSESVTALARGPVDVAELAVEVKEARPILDKASSWQAQSRMTPTEDESICLR